MPVVLVPYGGDDKVLCLSPASVHVASLVIAIIIICGPSFTFCVCTRQAQVETKALR